jgi:hypothetical protein
VTQLRVLPDAAPIRLGRETDRVFAASHYSGWPEVIDTRQGKPTGPTSQLDRVGSHAQTVLGTGTTADGTILVTSTERLLSANQCRLIYQRTPDVRAAIDGIVRRVATNDWQVEPLCDPSDELYDAAMEEAQEIQVWLAAPTEDLDLFQEVMTATLTDLLVWDAGALELVPEQRKPTMISEMVSLRGADVHPQVTEQGRLVQYVQEPTSSIRGTAVRTVFSPAQILYFRLFPNNEGPEGLPLLESLVYEIAAILRAAEAVCADLNYNELPPGLLVVAGLAKEAQQRFTADFSAKNGQDWRLRPVFSERAGLIDAKWIELRRAPRELQISELAKDIQRTIWRVFGVMPVEMGDTGDMPRATAHVQLDVGSSHLLTPIMDLVEAKLTHRVVPRRIRRKDLEGLIGFRWKRARDLTPGEQLQRAEAVTKVVTEGVLTTNEGRQILGFGPREEGDVLIRGGKRLVDLIAEATVSDEEPSDEEREDGGDGDDEHAEAEEDPEEEDVEEEDEEAAAKSRRRKAKASPEAARWRGAGARRVRSGPSAAPSRGRSLQEARAADEMPSDWQSPGRFTGVRTLDLLRLWDEVQGYGAEVNALWEEARAGAVAATAARYRPKGFDAEARGELLSLLLGELDRLFLGWSSASGPRYEAVALSAAKRASVFTGTELIDPAPARARAAMFHRQAMAYLVAPDGLLTDLRSSLSTILLAVTDQRGGEAPLSGRMLQRGPILSPEADTVSVVAAIAHAWDALRHRITNWTGKMLDLAYDTLASEVEAGKPSGRAEGIKDAVPGEPVDWYYEWVVVGDERSCDTCRTEGGKGFQPLSTLAIRPGNGTRCRSNCRCVLVLWTKAEIDGGRAQKMNSRAIPVVIRAPIRREEATVAGGAMDREVIRSWLVDHYSGTLMPAERIRILAEQWRAGHHAGLLRPPTFATAFRGIQIRRADLALLLGDAGVAMSSGRLGVAKLSRAQAQAFGLRSAHVEARAVSLTEAARDRSWTLAPARACLHAQGTERDALAGVAAAEAFGAVLLVAGTGDREGWALNYIGAADEEGVGVGGPALRDRILLEEELLTAERQAPYALAYASREALATDPGVLASLVEALVRPLYLEPETSP